MLKIIIPSFNDISVDVTAALINWQGFCELHDLDAVDTLADVPEILYVPIEVNNYNDDLSFYLENIKRTH